MCRKMYSLRNRDEDRSHTGLGAMKLQNDLGCCRMNIFMHSVTMLRSR